MAKLPRAIVPDVPHHVTQRGNRRQPVFFGDDDYRLYAQLLGEHCRACGVTIWAWCLMPNHVHLVLVPTTSGAMTKAIADTHRRYSVAINRRQGWRGNLWQGRFGSCAMDEPHALSALRYVERNPERARLAARPEDWPWSSARAHLGIAEDGLVEARGLDHLVPDWRSFLDDDPPSWQLDVLREHVRTGRPLGATDFVADVERRLGRTLAPAKRGRKPKVAETANG
jgi:putative transposase